ncbi:hypothetical protein [Photobacterium frigidiphilum]
MISNVKKPPILASRLVHYYNGDITFRYLDNNTKKAKHS